MVKKNEWVTFSMKKKSNILIFLFNKKIKETNNKFVKYENKLFLVIN